MLRNCRAGFLFIDPELQLHYGVQNGIYQLREWNHRQLLCAKTISCNHCIRYGPVSIQYNLITAMYLYAPRKFYIPNALTCRIYYDTCSSDIIGYVQSATNVCFYSNSGTSTPYEYVLQNSKKGNCSLILGEKSVLFADLLFRNRRVHHFPVPHIGCL